MAGEFYAEILRVLRVHEDHRYVNVVIGGCVHRLCADIPVPPIFCVRASTMLRQMYKMSAHVWTPESGINRTITHPWCLQLSVYVSI